MKTIVWLLVLVIFLFPGQVVSAQGNRANVVTLTAAQVNDAADIESAINEATASGTRQGTVVLDGREGIFLLTGADRSVNIFASNLVLRGKNQAVISGCDDGLFFDNFPIKHILVEEITFQCSGDGVEAAGDFRDVTFRGNLFRVDGNGIIAMGYLQGWQITGSLIQAGADGIRLMGARKAVISGNHLAGTIGVVLLADSQSLVRKNAIQAAYQGVLIGQESWGNMVQGNTILGVSASGIALEPGVARNRVLANSVACPAGSECLTVEASPAVAEVNVIAGNRP